MVVDFIERGREMGAIRWASWEKFARWFFGYYLHSVDIHFFFSSPSRLWNFFKFINTRSMGRNKVGWG